MATTIVTKKGSGAPAASDLVEGELAVDTTNGRLYTENSSAAVVELGSNPSGNITFGDNGKAIFGAGSDLQIYHTGTYSLIADTSGTGPLRVVTNAFQLNNAADTQNMLVAAEGGAVTLYNAGNAKLATTSTGIDVTGSVTADGLTVDGAAAVNVPSSQQITFSRTGSSVGSGKIGADSTQAMGIWDVDDNKVATFYQNQDVEFYEDTGTTAKLFWDASAESLGIGTTSPAREVHVTTAGQNGVRLTSTAFGADFGLLSSVGGTNGFGIYDYTASAYRFNIDSSGNVGIGTSSPSAKLTSSGVSGTTLIQAVGVDSNGFADVEIKSTGTSGGSRLYFSDTAAQSGSIKYSHSNNSMQFSTAATERMRIDSSGNVGIGTSSPDTLAHLAAGAGAAVLRLENTDTFLSNDEVVGKIEFETQDEGGAGVNAYIQGVGVSTDGATRLEFGTGTSGSPSTRMTVNNNGNVGIGTSSPSEIFEVSTATANTAYLRVGTTLATSSHTVDSDIAGLEFYSGDSSGSGSGVKGSIRYKYGSASGATTHMTFHTADVSGSNDVERMRIDASGNLLVGKSASNSGTAGIELTFNHIIVGTRDGDTAQYLNRLTSDGNIIEYQKDGTTVGSIGTYSSTIQVGQGNAYLKFANATDTITPANGNGTDNDNALDLGQSGARFKDIYATNGTIQTSDRNEKQDIAELSDAEQRVAVACKGLLRKFRWKSSVAEKGDEARTHFGIIAQDLQAAFAAEGLDAGDYAMFISTTWTDEETNEERTRMGVRYSELLAFIISAI